MLVKYQKLMFSIYYEGTLDTTPHTLPCLAYGIWIYVGVSPTQHTFYKIFLAG